jgi:membrane protease YdiL (CAAX protease family)
VGQWLTAFGRVFLFVALFLALLLGGGLLLQVTDRGDSFLLQSVVTAIAAFVAGAILIRRLEHRPAGALGLAWTSRTLRELALGLAIGLGALASAVVFMLIGGGLRYTGQPGNAAAWLTVVASGFGTLAIAAFEEEVLFRGYPFQVLVQAIGGVAATLLASAIFAVAHAPNPNVDPFALVNIFLAGILLSVAYLRTRSLWFATAVHLGWNWGMALLFDLPVSGLEVFDAPLYEPAIGGPRWFTGGAFGPEGGIVGSLAFAFALFAVLKTPGLTVAPEMAALRPLGMGVDSRQSIVNSQQSKVES